VASFSRKTRHRPSIPPTATTRTTTVATAKADGSEQGGMEGAMQTKTAHSPYLMREKRVRLRAASALGFNGAHIIRFTGK
jgi:hypothetical protein